MKKAGKAKHAKAAKKARTANKARSAKKTRKTAKARKTVAKAAKKAAAASALGCCTIVFNNRPSESVPHVSRSDCTRLARASGGVGQWNPGECA